MESLAQLEVLCERLYNSQDSAERAHAESTLKCFSVNVDYIPQCQYILDNALTPYALMLASSSLLKQVTEHSLSLQLRLDIRNYLVNYLANRGPELQTFVVGSLIQLLCRITKFGWFDDDRFKEVVKESFSFLSQATSEHYAIGLKILNQLVCEMNQPNPGLPSTNHRRVACSFRDQSLFQIFQISINSLHQLKDDATSRLQELALSLSLKCLSFDFVGTSIDESSEEFGTVQIPAAWKPVLEEFSTVQIFFDYYAMSKPPLSKEALECLVRLASVRRSLFTNDATRSNYLSRLMTGTKEILNTGKGVLLRAMGYPPRTRIYLAGSETFGGQRVLIPFRAMYANLVDRTSLCSKEELANVVGPETPLPPDPLETLPAKSVKQQKDEWDKGGPRPGPLPPPPDRPIYRHELKGWYGWIGQNDTEPPPTPSDLREQAHRLLWDALDYIVSVEANAFFPGFDNDGSGWPDFASLVMGHRVYKMASATTYRPNRKYLTELLNSTSNHLYYPPRNFTVSVKDHLNKSLAEEGLTWEFHLAKPSSFLSHPVPECLCTLLKTADIMQFEKGSRYHQLYVKQDECPTWLEQSLLKARAQEASPEDESQESEKDELEEQFESEGSGEISGVPSFEQDVEIDPDD